MSSCYHIRAFATCSPQQMAAALVSNRLDYRYAWDWLCQLSSLRLAVELLTRLQRIQNSVARIVLQQPPLSSRDTLQRLHWLPVKWRIQFKLASPSYKVLHTITPSYLSERRHPYVSSRTVRSSSSANLYVLRTNLRFGLRSFYTAALTVWEFSPLYSSVVSNLKHF